MKRFLVCFLLAVWVGGAEKKKKKNPWAIEVVEVSAHRGSGSVTVDGKVRNVGDRPIEKLVVLFDFIGPSGGVVTTQRLEIDEPLLDPGEEAVFRGEVTDPVRAVRYRVNATDKLQRDFNVTNPGPFVVE